MYPESCLECLYDVEHIPQFRTFGSSGSSYPLYRSRDQLRSNLFDEGTSSHVWAAGASSICKYNAYCGAYRKEIVPTLGYLDPEGKISIVGSRNLEDGCVMI